jgi:hypothetical protein
MNTGQERMAGEIHFFGDGTETQPGERVEVDINGVRSTVFEYDIPSESIFVLKTSGVGAILPADPEAPEGTPPPTTLQTGWIKVAPFEGFAIPHAYATTSYSDANLAATVTHTAFEGQTPSRSFRLYAEASGEFDAGEALSKQTAVAFANPSGAPVIVRLQLVRPDGRPGPAGDLRIPPNGHIATFLNHVPGLENVALPFQGVIEVTTNSPAGIVGSGALATWSDRGAFIFTTTGPIVEDAGEGSTIVFPHIAEGGGYTTRFVVLTRPDRQPISGVLRYFDQEGRPYDLTIQ